MSPERESRRIPEWARRERISDLAWIGENLHVLWPFAETGYVQFGRGAVVVDTLTLVVHEGGESNPMIYVPEEQIKQTGNEDALRMVREYDPDWEFVTGMLKPKGRESFYRMGSLVDGQKGSEPFSIW